MELKKWYQSLTIWLNVIPVIVVILENVMSLNIIPESSAIYFLVVINVLNVIVRTFKTNSAIKL